MIPPRGQKEHQMFRRAQSMIEYAVLIGLVATGVAGIAAVIFAAIGNAVNTGI